MDNISNQSSYWNGRFWNTVNLIYSDLYNVTPIDVPYSNMWRVNSYFLETRGAYIEKLLTRQLPQTAWGDEVNDYFITDAKIIWDDKCDKTTWRLRCHCLSSDKTKKKIISYAIKDWQIRYNEFNTLWDGFATSSCISDKLIITNHVRKIREWWYTYGIDFYEANYLLDNVTVQGELGCKQFDNWESIGTDSQWNEIVDFYWYLLDSWVQIGDYIFVYSTAGRYDSWVCWQVRQILWIREDGKRLILSSQWMGLPSIKQNETEVRWYNISLWFFEEYGEVPVFCSKEGLHVAVSEYVSYRVCDYSIGSWTADVVDIDIYNDVLCMLMSSWYIFHWHSWYNKFYITSEDTNYVGADKHSIVSWRNVLLVMWERKIDVAVQQEDGSLFVYTQTNNVGIHNRRAYWEYEGSICLISSERRPRLLAMKIVATTWNQMLEYEDIGWYIQNRLDKLREDENIRVDTYENDLRLYVSMKTVLSSSSNMSTRMYLYDKRRQLWYEHFIYSIILWSLHNFYYGSGIISYSKYDKEWDIITNDIFYVYDADVEQYHLRQKWYKIPTKIARYINENEYNNGQVDANGNTLDLFRILSVKSMNILLGTGLYTSNTKIHIINYRHWYGIENIIDKWVKILSMVASGNQPNPWEEQSECSDTLNTDVPDNASYLESCDSVTNLYDTERQKYVGANGYAPYEEAYEKIRVKDDICVNDWMYNYSNVYPLYINLNEVGWESELVKIEITSWSWDSISFGWALVELEVENLNYKGADGEYTVNFDKDCPKHFLRKPHCS